MKKVLLSLAVAGFLLSGNAQAQTLYTENFNSTSGTSMPTGWTATPATGWKTGNQASTGSSSFAPPDLDGRFAIVNDDASQSSDNSNSQMISKTYDLSGQGAGLFASMDVSFLGASYQGATEHLTFEASTDGGTTWTVLKTFQGNQNSWWGTYYVDLSSVAGNSSVSFNWRYSDGNGWVYGAAVDNFVIFHAQPNDIALTSVSPVEGDAAAYGTAGGTVNLSGTFLNNGSSAITSYTVNYQLGSNAPVATTQSANVSSFSSGTFSNIPVTIPSTTGDYPIKVWLTLSGDNNPANDSANAFVSAVSFIPTKHLTFEEATGTWCGWCPRGSYNMKQLAINHPDAAAQIAVHNQDPMTIAAYDQLITTLPGFTGFPTVVVDRTFLIDPGDMEAGYQLYKNNFGFADISMDAPAISGTSVNVNVTVKPAVDINGAKLALVVTENNVTGTGNNWAQVNYYANNAAGPMGGYENLPSPITDEVYDFVNRLASPSPAGAASGLPASMTAGQTYTASLSGTLDASWKTNDLSYIVLLIGSNGQIMNSTFINAELTGINNVSAGLNEATIYPNPSNIGYATLNVSSEQTAKATVTVTDVMGRVVATMPSVQLNQGTNAIKVDTHSLADGAYFVSLNTEKGGVALKLQVIK